MMGTIINSTSPYAFRILMGFILICLIAPLSIACTDSRETIPVNDAGLTIYSSINPQLIAPVIQDYAESAGIEVFVRYTDSSELASIIEKEGKKTLADVLLAQHVSTTVSLEAALAKVPENISGDIPSWAKSNDSDWVGIFGRHQIVAYNRSALTRDEVPSRLWELIEARWGQQVGIPSQNILFQAMLSTALSYWGDQRMGEWLSSFRANEPRIYKGNPEILDGLKSGEIAVAIMDNVSFFRLGNYESESSNIGFRVFKLGDPGATLQVSTAAIIKGSKKKDNAHEFIQFLLSQETQTYFDTENFVYPIINPHSEEVTYPPASFDHLGKLKTAQKLLRDAGMIR